MNRYCFGVDIGGTTVKLGLFNASGDLLEKWEIPTVTEDNGKAILPDVARSIQKKMDELLPLIPLPLLFPLLSQTSVQTLHRKSLLHLCGFSH